MNFSQWSSQLSLKNINKHHLNGYFYNDQWQQQFTYNHLRKDELSSLGAVFQSHNIQAILLKGFALMEDTYKDYGQRFASDIDILINKDDLQQIVNVLIQANYKIIKEKTWKGNDFKVLLSKKTSYGTITLELHTRLFWHTDKISYKDLRHSHIQGFYLLNLEEQLLHLCGHLAFQHNFLKLFWLFDIHEFLQKHKEQINFQTFWQQSRQCDLFISCYLSLKLVSTDLAALKKLKLSYKESVQIKILSRLINQEYLISPRKHKIRYFLIKHLIKDHFHLNFSYNFFWLLQKISVLF